MRKQAVMVFCVAVLPLLAAGRAHAQATCEFVLKTPAPGPGAGNVTTSVEWKNCPPAGNSVEVALFKVTGPKMYAVIGTKSINNVGATGVKTWTWTGLTSGTEVVANISVYDNLGMLIASVDYTPAPPKPPIVVP